MSSINFWCHGTTSDAQSTLVTHRNSKLYNAWQRLTSVVSTIFNNGDALLSRLLLSIQSFLQHITWQSLLFLVIISIGYAACVVGVMALVRLNFGSWFNFDYQFGIGTLLIVVRSFPCGTCSLHCTFSGALSFWWCTDSSSCRKRQDGSWDVALVWPKMYL